MAALLTGVAGGSKMPPASSLLVAAFSRVIR
jgi:hypothetical protein